MGIFGCLILPGKIGIWRAKNGDQLDQALGDGLKNSEKLTFLLTIWGECYIAATVIGGLVTGLHQTWMGHDGTDAVRCQLKLS